MRRLLLITHMFRPENAAAAVRANQLWKYLPEHGYHPLVVTASVGAPSNDDDLVWRVPAGNTAVGTSLLSSCAYWFTRYCSPYNDRLSWAPHAAAAAARIIKTQAVEAVYSTSPFLSAHFAALWLKLRFGHPWIADFQDPIRDNPFRTKRWPYPYDRIVERSFFRHADRLVANTDTVASAWRRRYPQWAEKISILWNSFDPLDAIEPRRPPSRPYRVLAHVGSLYGGRHPAQLLASFERLDIRPSHTRVKLLGPMAPDVLAACGSLFERLSHRGVLTYSSRLLPREEALRETADADYLLLLDINESNAAFQLPSKLMDYVRFGKPILAYTPKDSPVERTLARCGLAYLTIDPQASEQAADQALLEFLRIPPEARCPSGWFEATFSAQTLTRTTADLLDGLLRTGNVDEQIR